MKYINLFICSVIITILCANSTVVIAQNKDMQRDLIVMEAVLTEIVNSTLGKNGHASTKKAKASYVEGRGILIKIPALNTNTIGIGSNVLRIIADDEDGEGVLFNTSSSSSSTNKEENEAELLSKVESAMRTFLVNYGDLARELPEDEKIILLFNKSKRAGFEIYTGNRISIGSTNSSDNDELISQFSAEVLKSDIMKFKAGKLTEDAFWNKVTKKKVSAKDADKEKLEFNVLAKIFESRLSQNSEGITEVDDNIIIAGDWGKKVEYEVVSGLGVVFNLNVKLPFTMSYIQVKGAKKRKVDIEELTEESEEWRQERDEKVEEISSELLESVREDMIAYGRTLRSLAKDEMLIVEISLPKCYECDLPGTYQLSVSKGVLEDYENRKLDLDAAMEKIIVKEKGKAKDKSSYENFYFNWRD